MLSPIVALHVIFKTSSFKTWLPVCIFFFGGRDPYDGLSGGVRMRGCVGHVYRDVACTHMGRCIVLRLSNMGCKILKIKLSLCPHVFYMFFICCITSRIE